MEQADTAALAAPINTLISHLSRNVDRALTTMENTIDMLDFITKIHFDVTQFLLLSFDNPEFQNNIANKCCELIEHLNKPVPLITHDMMQAGAAELQHWLHDNVPPHDVIDDTFAADLCARIYLQMHQAKI
jgi:hypothetical protein